MGFSPSSQEDVLDLVVAYAKQETIEPLRGALRWILWGLASMAFICTGLVFIVLGVVRASQDVLGESFQQSWSFVSYFAGVLACGIVVAFALSSIKKDSL
ncbi:MAG: hypothetical protein EBY23_08635 [Actinobacteria bacterium]|jgi:hypothetical protein|uniref:Unannotated protein n=1 Tax=freshwater metagenome TaxID=449393 RepID=A0A6J7UM17_9ZZZZ|nr:hypothetical protein [Actinomycetota bacterium]MTH93488.1 hypothetical protein [Actinomycetota bacterium]NDG66956.1 hypothetical protein [Actinomycetota bacterium]